MNLFRILPTVLLALAGPHVSAITIWLMELEHSACGNATGSIDITVTGGVAPYTYLWNNGSTTEDLTGLTPGTYSVTVTDSNSDQATLQWTLVSTQLMSPSSAQDGHVSCIGQTGGQVRVIEAGLNGQPPYTYTPPPDGIDSYGHPYFTFPVAPSGTQVAIDVMDANGCTGTVYEPVVGPQTVGGPYMVVSNIQGSCTGGVGGSVRISNIYDGTFYNGPSYTFLDASDNPLWTGSNAPDAIDFTGLAPGDYHFVRDWDPFGYLMAYPCNDLYDRVDLTIPDLGVSCGTVSGTIFIDNDEDCTQDAAEVGVPYLVMEVMPGPVYTITNGLGQYAIDLGNGSYSLGTADPSLIPLCPATTPVPFTINNDQVTLDLADSSTVALDLGTQLESTAMRPGFAGTYWARVRNGSPQVSGAVTITMAIDPALLFVNATPVPTNVAGNILTWQYASFTALQLLHIQVNVQVPPGTALGTPLGTTTTVQNTLSDANPGNDTATLDQVVTGSYDPNDKTARTSSRSSASLFFIDQDEWVDYTIRFQNTGTDTAFTVVITDTIAGELDMASFEQGAASHTFSVRFKPDRVVEWTFADILLPDSNVNEAASHGMVSFRIRPVQPLLPGTTIANAANIYFDFNAPVITDPSVLVAEVSTGAREQRQEDVAVYPNPSQGSITVVGHAILEARVMDMAGRVVHSQRTAPTDVLRCELDALHAGTYAVEVRTANGSATTLLLMIHGH